MVISREVPFFNYPALFKEKESEYMGILRDVLSRGAYILQQELTEFEKHTAEFLGVKHVLGVADGTNALMLALRAIDIRPGDEVILPSHTYVATASAVHYTGGIPILVDCGSDHMIDPDSIRKSVSEKTRAIMPVQLNGRTADMDPIMEIAKEHNLEIIEDAAQALGSRFKDQPAGSFGIAGSFSFYPAKLLGCFGDGGAIITNDDEIYEKLFLLRDHGRNRDGELVGWGTNCRLDNLQAAILDFKLQTYNENILRRREVAAMYQAGLGDLEELLLPPPPVEHGKHFDVYQNYEIEAEERDKLKVFLRERGVGTIIQFGAKALHQYPLGLDHFDLPYTERVYQRALLLPMHVALDNDDVEYVIETIRAFYGR